MITQVYSKPNSERLTSESSCLQEVKNVIALRSLVLSSSLRCFFFFHFASYTFQGLYSERHKLPHTLPADKCDFSIEFGEDCLLYFPCFDQKIVASHYTYLPVDPLNRKLPAWGWYDLGIGVWRLDRHMYKADIYSVNILTLWFAELYLQSNCIVSYFIFCIPYLPITSFAFQFLSL